MSDRYQHRLQIYHFTIGKECVLFIYIKYHQEPSAIGAALTFPTPNEDFGSAFYPAYIRSEWYSFYGGPLTSAHMAHLLFNIL